MSDDQTTDHHLDEAVEAAFDAAAAVVWGSDRNASGADALRAALLAAEPFFATYYEDKGREQLWAQVREQRSAIGERGFAAISNIFVALEDECWIWEAGKFRGYGCFYSSIAKKQQRAHRVAYEMFVGPIPEGLHLDHLCRNRGCVNPAHLEPVTNRENVLRGVGPTAVNAKKTHCPRGHALEGDNIYWRPTGRRCKQCVREHNRENFQRAQARRRAEKEEMANA